MLRSGGRHNAGAGLLFQDHSPSEEQDEAGAVQGELPDLDLVRDEGIKQGEHEEDQGSERADGQLTGSLLPTREPHQKEARTPTECGAGPHAVDIPEVVESVPKHTVQDQSTAWRFPLPAVVSPYHDRYQQTQDRACLHIR